jgi:hypothetical protein
MVMPSGANALVNSNAVCVAVGKLVFAGGE